MTGKIANFLAFQVGWLACALGAARGLPVAGPVVVGVLLAFHLGFVRRRGVELTLVLLAAALGYLADSALVLGGVMDFPEQARLGGPTTIWMTVMWCNFAMTLRHSLGWLARRPLLAAILGLGGGPLAYYAGMRLGAVELQPLLPALSAVAVEWTLATPLLFWLSNVLERQWRCADRTGRVAESAAS